MLTHHNAGSAKPQRVVVIGARGFIGAALKRALDAERISSITVSSADVDLSKTGAAEQLSARLDARDAIVMLAALTPDKGRDIATLMKNLTMMQSVVDAAAKAGCAHFVYVSSDAVYAFDTALINEETAASPRDLYAAMHATRELMALSVAKAPVLILRPTAVYGAGDTHNSYGPNRFRRMAAKDGRITLFGEGEEKRDHIHVDDVAAVMVRCLLHRSAGTLNVATGKSHSFREVAEIVARQFERAVEVGGTPRANPVTHRHFDITNTIKAFPDLRFTPLEAGLQRAHRESAAAS